MRNAIRIVVVAQLHENLRRRRVERVDDRSCQPTAKVRDRCSGRAATLQSHDHRG
jgi:hypothetical protein